MTDWHTDPFELDPIPLGTQPWLLKSPQLSPVLRTLCQQFTLKRLQQRWQTCFDDEACALSCSPHSKTLVREICLVGDGIPWTFGRVVIPTLTYQHWQTEFSTLEEKPMGEHLLYHNPEINRSSFCYAHLTSQDPLLQRAAHALSPLPKDFATLWARRSVFHIAPNKPLLISDVFLPSLPSYPSHAVS